MSQKTLNNKGVALVTVVLFFLVLVILLGGVMFSSISNQGNAKLSKDHTSAYYVAESGLNITIEKLNQFLKDDKYDDIEIGQYTFMIGELKSFILSDLKTTVPIQINPSFSGKYDIFTEEVSTIPPYTFSIRSTGTVNDVSRTLVTTFEVTPKLEELMKAIVAKGSITLDKSPITGPIASLMDPPGSDINFTCNSGSLTNEIYIPNPLPAGSSVTFKNCNDNLTYNYIEDPVILNPFELPEYHTKDKLVKMTLIPGENTFPPLGEGKVGYYIDKLPSFDVDFILGTDSSSSIVYQLFVDDLDVLNNGILNVGNITVDKNKTSASNDKLKMFVTIDKDDYPSSYKKDVFEWDGNVNSHLINVETADLSKFQLIIKRGNGFDDDNPELFISNSNIFVGSLMMDEIDVNFGNLNFKGFIATMGETITFSSTADITGPMWIYAPNADVNSTSNVMIKGSIIADSVNFKNTTLQYLEYKGDLPPELNIPDILGGEPVPVGITVKFINFKEV